MLPGLRRESLHVWAGAGGDVGGLLLPGLTGLGMAVRGGRAAVEAASHSDEVVDAARTVAKAAGHADDVADAARAAAQGGEAAGAGQEVIRRGDPTDKILQARDATVRLYRAVSQAEYDDIMQTGIFREAPQSVSGKYFATQAEHATEWGRRLYGDKGFRVIAVEFPKHAVEAFDTHWKKLDGIGPAYYARMEQLVRYTIVGEVTYGR
ncbi:MAG: hypothetical protein K6T87_02120 [Roseiflexus sp.]|uniref:hypothetical protein n=1 Tax=Roseiflexus sp. TaxID=2562120 RepID=UPI0025F91261|nr:hypothetical protein [Roseiflexus sp.]MCL6539382.1 hypothetical protein [Roseiflexus sp.]